jgi:hypothetical protein
MTPEQTSISNVTNIANATMQAAKMGSAYSIWDLIAYLTYLVRLKAGEVVPAPSPRPIPTDEYLGNDSNKLNQLSLMMIAAMQAAKMPSGPTDTLTMKDLPTFVAGLIPASTSKPVTKPVNKVVVKPMKPSRR